MYPESFRFQVGDFTCYALRDGFFNYPLEMFFANAPPDALDAALRQRGKPLDRMGTLYTLLLVDTGEQRVLVDTGSGNAGASADLVFPGIDHVDTRTGLLLDSLARAGFGPGDVDTVIITHAHPDHVAGTLDDIGRLVFANARYLLAEPEWAFWHSPGAARAPHAMVPIARRNLKAMASRLTFVKHGDEVAPGINVFAAYGHTPGHLNVSLRSGDTQLLHIADTALHPLHLEHPDWSPALDLDPAEAAATRQRILDHAAERQTLVFAHHFAPFPALGRVAKRGDGWEWQPASPRG
jgi:glyoxylase-like metal-dependent hydrolase (beta-lactamase superfamily II)